MDTTLLLVFVKGMYQSSLDRWNDIVLDIGFLPEKMDILVSLFFLCKGCMSYSNYGCVPIPVVIGQ